MKCLKVAVMGAGGVGKSAITVRFINGHYLEMYDPTIEDSYRKQFTVDNEPVLLEILDTAGLDQYLTFNDMIVRESQGFVLVFSLTQRESLDDIKRLRENILRIKAPHGEHIPMVIVGNKRDLEEDRQITHADGAAYSATISCEYIETSARTNINVTRVFESLVRQLRQHPAIRAGPLRRRAREKKCLVQ